MKTIIPRGEKAIAEIMKNRKERVDLNTQRILYSQEVQDESEIVAQRRAEVVKRSKSVRPINRLV